MRTVLHGDIAGKHFHLAILTCGYETRASYIAQHFSIDADQHLVLDYRCPGLLSYNRNREFYEALPTAAFLQIDDDLSSNLMIALKATSARADPDVQIRVLIDISSCSRSVMAKIFLAISEVLPNRADISCAYALSAFEAPPDSELPSHISQPVVGDLSGWSDDLSKPPCAVIGLGFEPGRALGCMDYLEIPEVRLFMPVGVDPRFETAVREANAVLPRRAASLSYPITYSIPRRLTKSWSR
ncbi:hypothetical protein NKH73_27100 [Mesorhizobium sp. M0938]|uniref:hypothetical protein n=1 Tax=unclassified Mesorhizobium TaxID=325217 RepID=UPI00333B5D43